MFKKLASNLPFNPGLIQQITFYGKRLHKEQSLRRASFVFILAAMAVNILAISFPAQNTFAGSDGNIMVGGGASTKDGILSKFDQDPWVQGVYSSFGITRDDITKMQPETLSVSASTNAGKGLITAGRRPNGSVGEYPVDIAGANIYRHSLDSAFSSNSISVISCQKDVCGSFKAIVLICGNPVIDIYENQPPAPKPPIGFVDGSSCQSIYGWAFNNQYARYVHLYVDKPAFGGAVLGKDYFEVSATQDTRPDVPLVYPGTPSSVGWSWDGGPLRDDGKDHHLWVYVSDRGLSAALLGAGENIKVNFSCPQPTVTKCPSGPLAGQPAPGNDISKCPETPIVTCESTNSCPIPIVKCPSGPLTGQPAPGNDVSKCPEDPVASCVKLTILSNAIQKGTEGRFIITATAINGAKINGYRLDFGDGEKKTVDTNQGSVEINHKYDTVGNYNVKAHALTSEGEKTSPDCQGAVEVKPQPVPCPHDAGILFNDPACKPCPENPVIPASNTQLCIAKKVLSKKVANITQGITDANNTTAKAGDVLEYTLITQNTAKMLDIDHTTSESVSDLLDYATMNDTGTANLDSSNNLNWPKATIVAGSQLKQVFRVKIKSSIPSTPPSIANSGTYDLKLINFYGNSTTVNVQPPASLQVNNTVEHLPKTGAGSSLMLTFMTVCVIGFFYMRSRMLAKEIDIIKYDYSRGV